MLQPGNQRFTIYDAMEAKGVFSANPANAASGPAYKKELFPTMLYHPEGKEIVTDPGEILSTLMGPKVVGEKRELINRVVETQEELDKLLSEGWHRHPAKAHAAAGRASAPMGSEERIAELEAKLRETSQELKEAKALREPQSDPTSPSALVGPVSPSGAVKAPA